MSRVRTHTTRAQRSGAARRPGLAAVIGVLLGALLGALLVAMDASVARADDLAIWESGSSPGVPLALAPPVVDFVMDIDYSPTSAEGGGLYGMSEVFLAATGDLTFSSGGFSCEIFGCLYSPMPFGGGTALRLSGADDLVGQFAATQDLLTVSVSGTFGYVAIVSGRYLDATGVIQSLGTVRDIEPTIIARVPEPGFAVALAVGALGVAGASRRRAARPGRPASRRR